MLNLNLNLIRTVVGISEGVVCPAELISTTSIMGYYKFDGDYTKTLGEAFFGTISPVNVSLTSGKFGQSASFNGTNSYLPFGNNNLMEPVGTGGWTYSLWVKLNNVTDNMSIWDKRVVGSSGMRILLRPGLGNILITYGTQNAGVSGMTFTADTWTHICVRQNAGTNNFEVFVNGTSYGFSTRSSYTASGAFLNVGRGRVAAGFDGYFNGEMDDWQLYDRSLTDEEITALAAGTCPLTTP